MLLEAARRPRLLATVLASVVARDERGTPRTDNGSDTIRPQRPLADACPVCGGRESVPIHGADDQPALAHALADSAHAARRAPTAALRFEGCIDCGLVRNRSFRPDLASYGPGYLNTQRASATYLRHENGVAQIVIDLGRAREGAILEIGSGDGSVLRSIACALPGRRLVGFDPAGPALRDGDLELIASSFTGNSARRSLGDGPVAVACVRHVIEHVPDPMAFLVAIHDALPEGTPFVLEAPDLAWIGRRAAFYDFFHEHCCLFDAVTLRAMLAAAGFRVTRLARTFGGQYLLVVARRSAERLDVGRRTRSMRVLFERLADRIATGRRTVGAALAARACESSAPMVVWGAGAKGVSLLNQLDPAHVRCAVAIDECPLKQGRYVPGSGHPIRSPEHLRSASERSVLIMNPNYAVEVATRLGALGVCATTHLVTALATRAVRR